MKNKSISTIFICLLCLSFCAHAPLFAQECSSGKPVDHNCDGQQKIAVLGDSFVFGVGDSKIKTLNGYIGRTQKLTPKIRIDGFGEQGQRTAQLLQKLRDTFSTNNESKLLTSLLEADAIFLDLGRNDRWLFGTPADALKNLQIIRNLLRTEIKQRTGVTPLVVLAVLMLPNRGAQGPWVKELNKLILKSNSPDNPANLRFDLVSKRLIGADQIHPTSRGYVEISKVFKKYLTKNLPALIRKAAEVPVA